MIIEDSLAVATIHTLSWQHAYKGIMDQNFLDNISIAKREANWRLGIEKNDPKLIRLVACEGDDILGFVCGLENRSLDLLPSCDSELWAIYVHPQFEGKGVGKKLIEKFKEELCLLGKKQFCIWVLRDNRKARAFYERQGGVLASAEKNFQLAGGELAEVAYEFSL